MKTDNISYEYIMKICRLYNDKYDDRVEDSKPPTTGTGVCIPGDDWKPGMQSAHKSLAAFQRELAGKGIKLSTSKIKKILITGGLWTTERSREVQRLFKQYVTAAADGGEGLSEAAAVKKISLVLGISTVSVSVNIPYYHVVYNLENKTSNARRCERYKERRCEGDLLPAGASKGYRGGSYQHRCFVCGEKLDKKNSSDEHILLNALGGHLHSPNLLCRQCNSKMGNRFDDELARELNYAASYLNVPRQRGVNQIIHTSENEEYDLLPGGKPVLKKPVVKKQASENAGKIEIVARNESEAREIIRSLSKKQPGIDADAALQQMKVRKEYLGRTIGFSAGIHATQIYPSIIKSSIEYYLLCGGDREVISHLIPLLKGNGDVGDYCKYYYPETSWFDTGKDGIYHILYVKGAPEERLLYGFVSYFGVIQCLILLNDNYDGPEINHAYIYNVMTKEKSDSSPLYGLKRDEVLHIIQAPYEQFTNPMLSYMKIFMKKAENYRINQQWELFLRTAWDRTIGKYPEGTHVTTEMMREFTDEFSIIAAPWLAAHLVHEEKGDER